MKITGELLKAERIKKNLSVADVAGTLKLSSKIISSIESGDIDELPAKTFIRGFVKSYAQFLKLDDELILRQFQEEMGSTQPLPKNPPPTPHQGEEDHISQKKPKTQMSAAVASLDLEKDNRKKTIIYVSIAFSLLLVILIINSTIEKYQKETIIDKTKIEQIQPLSPAQTTEASASATAPVETANQTASNAPVETVAEKKEAALLITQAADPKNLKKAEPEALNSSSTPEDFDPSPNKPVEIIIEAKKEVELFYAKGNSKNFIRIKLAPKEIQIIRSQVGIYLKAQDGSLFNITLNGVEKGAAANSSKPVKLTF